MSSLEQLEDLLEKFKDPEKQIYELELKLLRSQYKYFINIFYFIHFLCAKYCNRFFNFPKFTHDYKNFQVENINSFFYIGKHYGELRDRNQKKKFRPILFKGDVVLLECSNFMNTESFELTSQSWFNHLDTIIKQFGIFNIILGGGVRVKLKLLNLSKQRTRAEHIDGAGFKDVESFLKERHKTTLDLKRNKLKRQEDELSEPDEINDVFFDSNKTFEEHISSVWKTKDVDKIILMMDLSLLSISNKSKITLYEGMKERYSNNITQYKRFLLKNLNKNR